MKFLFFNFILPQLLKEERKISGGAAVEWRTWIHGFLANEHQFGVLTWSGVANTISKKLEFDIVESFQPKKGKRWLRVFYYQIPGLFKAIRKYNPDYLIQTSPSIYGVVLLLISKVLGIKFIHRIASDIHVDERISELYGNKLIVLLYTIVLRYSDFIFAQNSYQLNKLKVKYPAKNIFILHNPFELETDTNDILHRDKRKYVAWIGNFRKAKNLSALAQIVPKLYNIQFKIAGGELQIDNETKKAITALKNYKNVEFVGYLSRVELKTFLSEALALLNTSFYEGFSNTFLEAWASGVPVVTTKNVNPDEIVSKYNLGKVADDYDQLAENIKMIIDLGSEEYDKLTSHCYEYVKVNHDPKMLAEKFVNYLKSNE